MTERRADDPTEAEWAKVTLGGLCDREAIHIQTGPFGSQLHASDYVPAGVPVVPTEAIHRGRIALHGLPHVSAGMAERLVRHRLRCGDILFARRGVQATGLSGIVISEQEGWLAGTGVILLRVTSKDLDPRYLSAVFTSAEGMNWLRIHAVGAVMPNLNEQVLRLFPLQLPPLPEQRAIAHVLGTIDDKIELNRKMNETLEAMARALFKSWFVDFDPVRAKMDGRRPAGMDAETAALFPSSFVDSELGKIPKGWKTAAIGQGIRVVKGKSYRSEDLQNSGTALVTLKSFQRGGGYRPDGLKPYVGDYKPEQEVRPGELVIAFTDVTQAAEVIGKPALVGANSKFGHLVASLDVGVVRSVCPTLPLSFLYCLFLTSDFQEHAYAHTNGSTVLHLDKDGVVGFVSTWPPGSITATFDTVVAPLLDMQQANEAQSRTLAALRDTLLPKLLSGELRIPEAKKMVEAAT